MAAMVKTHRRGQNAFRAPGVTEVITALDQAMDEMAAALKIDPLEFRRINCGEIEATSGLPYSGKNLLACYDRAAELAGWAERESLRESSPTDSFAGSDARRKCGMARVGRLRRWTFELMPPDMPSLSPAFRTSERAR